MKLYHGTTTSFKIKKLLPPINSGNQRESFRTKYNDRVFATNSIPSARKYANKAVEKYGGDPIVYEVILIGNFYQINNTEFIGDKGIIKKIIYN